MKSQESRSPHRFLEVVVQVRCLAGSPPQRQGAGPYPVGGQGRGGLPWATSKALEDPGVGVREDPGLLCVPVVCLT